jgi:hypothetical protein
LYMAQHIYYREMRRRSLDALGPWLLYVSVTCSCKANFWPLALLPK